MSKPKKKSLADSLKHEVRYLRSTLEEIGAVLTPQYRRELNTLLRRVK